MSWGRIYRQVAACHRRFVLGYPLLKQCWIQTFFTMNPLRARILRSECQHRFSLGGRLRRGFQLHSVDIGRVCMQKVEYIVAQQIRRVQEIRAFYLQMCGRAVMLETAHFTVLHMLNCIRLHMWRRSQMLVLSASTFPIFCWSKERIPEEELLKFTNELEAVACLRLRACSHKSNSSTSCESKNLHMTCSSHFHNDRLEDPWELFVNQGSLLVWRREVPNHRGEGLYEYKVYGVYNDITALDFLAVHIDCDFRKEWDSSAVSLEILENESDSNSEVVYWETQWPRMMSNRDYVYKRRHIVSEKHNVVILVNQNTQHHAAPVKPGKQRVSEYWSIIVIKPMSGLDKPGLEFSMTYFDNPGLVFPSAFASWATATGFPEYLNKLHDATLVFADRRIKKENTQKEMELAAKEEERKRREEGQKDHHKDDLKPSQRKASPEAWEVVMGGGPVLNSTTPNEKSRGASDKINSLINKLVFMVS